MSAEAIAFETLGIRTSYVSALLAAQEVRKIRTKTVVIKTEIVKTGARSKDNMSVTKTKTKTTRRESVKRVRRAGEATDEHEAAPPNSTAEAATSASQEERLFAPQPEGAS